MTVNNDDHHAGRLGYRNPFADYLKFLPHEILLPTFYTPEERELLHGTSLALALEQKMTSLENEFDMLKAATQAVPWCKQLWWGGNGDDLSLDDWKLADAMYRSRALELPRNTGLGMVPVIDMANHDADDSYNARFEVGEESSSVLLVVRDNKTINVSEEITIMYGGGGACEMIFSYGFVEEHASSAREIFLDLLIPTDDPLRLAKIRYAKEAPGFRLFVDSRDKVSWESAFVWWACVNEEDGLDFRVEQTVTGGMELKAMWKDSELRAEDLPATLMADELRDVFVLRAVVMIQDRVERAGADLAATEEVFDHNVGNNQVREQVYKTIGILRKLEMQLLARAYDQLEVQVSLSFNPLSAVIANLRIEERAAGFYHRSQLSH
jgi:hypothetical protein